MLISVERYFGFFVSERDFFFFGRPNSLQEVIGGGTLYVKDSYGDLCVYSRNQ